MLDPSRDWPYLLIMPGNGTCLTDFPRNTLNESFDNLPADTIALSVQAPEGCAYRLVPYGSVVFVCRNAPGLQPGGWRFDPARLRLMLNESDRITSHLLFQWPKFEPYAPNSTRAPSSSLRHLRHLRHCVIPIEANPPAAIRRAPSKIALGWKSAIAGSQAPVPARWPLHAAAGAAQE